MADIKLENITKVYEKDIVAVRNFSMYINDKEFIVLVGPSGCGKSTTLRMVAGLEEITEGELYIGNRLVNDVEPKDRDIAMVFQSYALYPHMTVAQNLGFSLKLRRTIKSIIKEKVLRAAEILEITELMERKPRSLSGGQRQRVAIGRAIVREPQVFLMDEPLSNLDTKLRNQMRSEIIKLRERVDTTFIYVTHDQTEAMTLGDRIVVMNEGRIQQIGTPQEVFNHPENMFVAGFIGAPQMNFIPAKLEAGGFAIAAGQKIELTEDMRKRLDETKRTSDEVVLGIRPEHLSLLPPGSAGAAKATLDVFEMMGSEMHMHVKYDDKEIIIRVPVGEALDGYKLTQRVKEDISFTFPAKWIHLFDKDSQQSL
jgi:multiple sugar transport system ATP-binding protein